MRLLELSANHDTFHSVHFNRNGLSLVIGKKSNPEDRDREHSTNGVGKSLLIYLVNFCLGSSENPSLYEHLPDWEFTLTFELESQVHKVTRSTSKQDQVQLDGEVTDLESYKQLLGRELFGLKGKPVKHLTFRGLISLFLRQGKHAYVAFEKTQKLERQYAQQLRNAFLLGLDEKLVDRKRELKEEKDNIKSIRAQFGKDSLLREYFHGEKDAGLELRDLEDEISRLEIKVRDFRVADNYEEISASYEKVRRSWKEANNELSSHRSSLRQIELSLQEQPDVSLKDVRRVYKSVQIDLPELVKKHLDEVEQFHLDLTRSRSLRLTSEKHRIERRIAEIEGILKNLNREKDEYYHFLGTHGALAEYEILLNTLSDRRRIAGRLIEFQQLKKTCDERWQRVKLEMSEEDVRTSEYLAAAVSLKQMISERFRGMARRIWPSLSSGLLIENNDGDNLIRFDIEARVEGDASDGKAESKIFCFDMTVLLSQQNHSVRFLMHDNRLFPGIDPRQRAEIFRIAHELGLKHDCQYIASLNEDNFVAMRDVMEANEFEAVLRKQVVLELMDDTASGKLLGITVDLKYD